MIEREPFRVGHVVIVCDKLARLDRKPSLQVASYKESWSGAERRINQVIW